MSEAFQSVVVRSKRTSLLVVIGSLPDCDERANGVAHNPPATGDEVRPQGAAWSHEMDGFMRLLCGERSRRHNY